MPRLVPRLSVSWSRYPLTSLLTLLLILFLILFPKGGVKVGEVPLTWGYLLLGATLPVLSLIRLTHYPIYVRRSTLLVMGCLVPFNILFYYSYRQNGIGSFGNFASTFVSFTVLPAAFLLVYPYFFRRIDGVRLERLFRFCVLGAAAFGIFLFVLYPLTGQLLEIPYLTVNADDYGLLESTKHIARGPFLKLISTYNNGNLYGVATLILLPLYDHFEPKRWRRTVLKFALILTLSRTIWIGLIVDQLFSLVQVLAQNTRHFPRFRVGPAIKQGVFIGITLSAIVAGLVLTLGDISFLFDKELGGRSGVIVASIENVTWLPAHPINGFLEVVYASALMDYGVLGLLAIILIFISPILIFLGGRGPAQSPVRIAAFKGLLLYMILAGIDGAIDLIPVMAFYWFAYMIFLEGWPSPLPALPYAQASLSATIEVPGNASASPANALNPSARPDTGYGAA
jgi:hypothetical protein